MTKLRKKTILIPLGENGLELNINSDIQNSMKSYKKEEGYFFNPSELNDYISEIINLSLETAAKNSKVHLADDWVRKNETIHPNQLVSSINIKVQEESIINSFEEIFDEISQKKEIKNKIISFPKQESGTKTNIECNERAQILSSPPSPISSKTINIRAEIYKRILNRK
jgi:hypothetical protein